MSLSAKRECLARIHGRYQRAGRPYKSRILAEFCATCGYHPKSALRLLNQPLRSAPPKRSGPKVLYDPGEVLPVLKGGWLASDQLCSKLLKAALPEWLEHYERRSAPFGEAFKEKLLQISPAQIDRLLRPADVRSIRRRGFAPRVAGGRSCGTRCPRAAGRRTRPAPVRSRRIPWRIATTAPRGITSIPSRLPSFTAAGRRTAPFGTRAPRPCLWS